MASPHGTPEKAPAFNETAQAILGSVAVGVVLATILAGNPLRATRDAYTDYSRQPIPAVSSSSTPPAQDAAGSPPANAATPGKPASTELPAAPPAAKPN